jgi:hypothetical protein
VSRERRGSPGRLASRVERGPGRTDRLSTRVPACREMPQRDEVGLQPADLDPRPMDLQNHDAVVHRGRWALSAGLCLLPVGMLIVLLAPLTGRLVGGRGPRPPLVVDTEHLDQTCVRRPQPAVHSTVVVSPAPFGSSTPKVSPRPGRLVVTTGGTAVTSAVDDYDAPARGGRAAGRRGAVAAHRWRRRPGGAAMRSTVSTDADPVPARADPRDEALLAGEPRRHRPRARMSQRAVNARTPRPWAGALVILLCENADRPLLSAAIRRPHGRRCDRPPPPAAAPGS